MDSRDTSITGLPAQVNKTFWKWSETDFKGERHNIPIIKGYYCETRADGASAEI